jgi:dethiobiotin synthase
VKRYYVTGTDTDVGKTRATAALARALAAREPVTIVKLVQTGLPPEEAGDAQIAAALAGCAAKELRRFALPADPWSAALAEGREPPAAGALAREASALAGSLVLEGSGGAAVPLNATESITDCARMLGGEAVLVVGLRLGCINHAFLTLEFLERRGMPVRAALLSERWGTTEPAYRTDVERALLGRVPAMHVMPHEPDQGASVAAAAAWFAAIL